MTTSFYSTNLPILKYPLRSIAYCDLCGTWDGCIHVDFALTLEKVVEPLEKPVSRSKRCRRKG